MFNKFLKLRRTNKFLFYLIILMTVGLIFVGIAIITLIGIIINKFIKKKKKLAEYKKEREEFKKTKEKRIEERKRESIRNDVIDEILKGLDFTQEEMLEFRRMDKEERLGEKSPFRYTPIDKETFRSIKSSVDRRVEEKLKSKPWIIE